MKRAVIALVLCALLWAAPAHAAPTLGTIAYSGACSGVTTCTASTTTSGNNRYLIGFLHCDGIPGVTVSAVFNTSETMTALIEDGTSRHIKIFVLIAPTATTADLTITWTNSQTCLLYGIPLSDTDQSTPHDGLDTATGNDADPTNAVACATGDLGLDMLSIDNDDGLVTADGDATEQADDGGAPLTIAVSTAAGAASINFSWATASNPWRVDGLCLNAVAGGGGGARPSGRALKGVGR